MSIERQLIELRAFKYQRRSAEGRCIAWELTFDIGGGYVMEQQSLDFSARLLARPISQCDAILSHLQTGATLTPLGAFNLCGTLALHSRIAELRERGHDIRCDLVHVGDKVVGLYSLGLKVAYG